MKKEILLKRLEREKGARESAERILEEKSKELYFKNLELEHLNEQLNNSLAESHGQLYDLKKEHLELFENSAVGIVLTKEQNVVSVNKTFCDLLGFSKEEIIGKTISDVTYKDDLEQSIARTSLLTDGLYERFSLQKRYKRKNGSYFWASTHVSEIKNREGETKYHLSVILDIHKEKIADNKLNQSVSQLQEINQRLESFAHIVSHDLKAPLNAMNTMLGWLKDYELDTDCRQLVRQMKERTDKMYQLINGVISYSKVSSGNEDRSFVQMEDAIDEAILLLKVPNHIQILRSGTFPFLFMNRAKLIQVFSNLLDNAIRHIDKPNGIVEIEAKEDPHLYSISIYDNGEGIEEEYFSKIFQMFNSLTPFGKNNGIGLSLVKEIIEQYGGTISVESKLGQFTKFQFTFSKKCTTYAED